jgi:hypothetical protein
MLVGAPLLLLAAILLLPATPMAIAHYLPLAVLLAMCKFGEFD